MMMMMMMMFGSRDCQDMGEQAVNGLRCSCRPVGVFSLSVTAEALRANIGQKSAISLQRGPVDRKFQVEGVAPYQPFFFSEN